MLIDLRHGGLLTDFTKLGWSSATSDLVRLEVSNDEVLDTWVGRHIEVHAIESARMHELVRLLKAHPGLSPADASAWLLAKHLGGALLTNDKQLRQLATAGDVAVIGILGIMDRLDDEDITTRPRLRLALERMLDEGARLPAHECETRRRRWHT